MSGRDREDTLEDIPVKRNFLIMMFSVVVLVGGCEQSGSESGQAGSSGGGAISSEPLNTPSSSDGTMFKRLGAGETGIDFANMVDDTIKRNDIYITTFAGGGVAVGDYDGDGKPDIYLSSQLKDNRLYRQVGDMKFEDVTDKAGVGGGAKWASGVTFVDINNDGMLDLYVCNYSAANQCFINNGDGTFTDKAKALGLDFNGASTMAYFADYDRDGNLDMFLLTCREYPEPGTAPTPDVKIINDRPTINPEQRELYQVQIMPNKRWRPIDAGQRDQLYRNNGDGTFANVTEKSGFEKDDYFHGNGAIWYDYNQDGWLDLYIANDFWDPDRLYRNNGNGTFTDVLKKTTDHTPWFSMGLDAADINNDGYEDLLVADMSATTHLMAKIMMGDMSNTAWFLDMAEPRQYMHNVMYLNRGVERLSDASYITGLQSSDWTWSVKFADFDLDGFVDVYFTNGTVRTLMNADNDIRINAEIQKMLKGRRKQDIPKDELAQINKYSFEAVNQTPRNKQTNLVFRNDQKMHFDKVAKAWGLDHTGISWGAATADLDRDGDLDLIVNNIDEPVSVYRNDVKESGRVLIRLKGVASPQFGQGAKVTVKTSSGQQMRVMNVERGFMSANEPLIHFGLGDVKEIERLTVSWPSGHVQTFENLQVNRLYTISEPAGGGKTIKKPVVGDVLAKQETLFKPLNSVSVIRHIENTDFSDFVRQPLLPNRLSTLGPGLAVGDVNGDGHDDFFLCGASGSVDQLYIGDGEGGFRVSTRQPWRVDKFKESMGALFFDADGDGDLDLYVGHGSVECEPGESMLEDRLYVNDGKGQFSDESDERLPGLRDSSSCVVGADFDRDGDIDLFVGSRVIPGQYPMPATSRLLINDGKGKFVDGTEKVAPGLVEVGLVTGGLWTDVDQDGYVDLMVTTEWGAVTVFRNMSGKTLSNVTAGSGIEHELGWWNGITGADIDHDGDIDYIVTNFGLNTKYKTASAEKPRKIFYGDFEGNGKMHVVEAKKNSDGTFLPVRGRSCSSNAMPFIAKKFETYRSFGLAKLDDIYEPTKLEKSYAFTATRLHVGVLINESEGGAVKLTFKALPFEAQLSAGFGVVAQDFDGDRHVDVMIAQNFLWPQRETSRFDTGLSVLLKGDGKGGFSAVVPKVSGIVIPRDAKSAVVGDFNSDNRPDLLVGRNDDTMYGFINGDAGKWLKLRLKGKAGDLKGFNGRVYVEYEDGVRQLTEVYGGSGYLSQSNGDVFVSDAGDVKTVKVIWSDGTEQHVDITGLSGLVLIEKP